MDKFLGQDIPEQERWQFLQDNADAVEKIGYTDSPPKNWLRRKRLWPRYQSPSTMSRWRRKRLWRVSKNA